MSNLNFINVNDALPQKECWCLVWAPTHPGWSRDKVAGGYVFAKFQPTYKIPWSIERYLDHPCVEAWVELPENFGH